MDQVRQESHLDVAEVDEKKVVDTETSIHDIKLPKKQVAITTLSLYN